MESLVDRGWVRHIGVSNFSLHQLRRAQEAMERHPIVSNQIDQTGPAASNANDAIALSQGAKGHRTNCRVESRNVATTSQNPDGPF